MKERESPTRRRATALHSSTNSDHLERLAVGRADAHLVLGLALRELVHGALEARRKVREPGALGRRVVACAREEGGREGGVSERAKKRRLEDE